MVTTLFSDEIVNSTELRNNQRYWLGRASSRPITITYGHHQLAIIDRETISNLYRQKYYLELVVKFCEEVEKKTNSNTFPWVDYLANNEKRQFHEELMTNVVKAIVTDNWIGVETLLNDWKATAETIQDTEAMKILSTTGRKNEYIALKE
jgi:hypothetical protein